VAGFTTLFVTNETAREIAGSTGRALIGLFSTPFIFEATCLFLFTVALLTYNQWRREKDGDDWVYMVTHEPDQKDLPPAITERLQGVVLKDKPEPMDEAQTQTGILEGYLELGMAAQAQAELFTNNDMPDTAETAALRLRVLAANPQTGSAVALLHADVARFPESKALLVQTALENARWLLKHLHRQDAAQVWVQEAKILDVYCLTGLPAGDPLRALPQKA